MSKKEVRRMVYVLNTPIITDYGDYSFRKIGVEEAKDVLAGGFVSAVGHQGTADVLTAVLGIVIPMNRIAVKMEAGDKAVVFRLTSRLPEGTVLTAEELKAIPYELGLLERVG